MSRRSAHSLSLAADCSPVKGNGGLRVVSIREFLRAQIEAAIPNALPLVHSTPSSNLVDVLSTRRLLATPCKVFKQNLCYLFVGRPAYKWNSDGDAMSWQLPFVVVLRPSSISPVKRIYPFDTGAFHVGRMPDYLTMFGLDAFNLGTDMNVIPALIERFFSNNGRYTLGQGLPREDLVRTHSLGARHLQIQALAQLYCDRSNSKIDDRARAIEIQIEEDVEISADNILGIVVPQQFAEDVDVSSELSGLGCPVETYPEFPLSVENYFSIVYERVEKFTKVKKRR